MKSEAWVAADDLAVTVAEFLKCGVSLDLPQLDYIEIQVDRREWESAKQTLQYHGFGHLIAHRDGSQEGT